MKKTNFLLLSALIFIVLISSAIIGVGAEGLSWYCAHTKDHKQPSIGHEFSFIDKYNGYYIDKCHNENCDEKVVYLTFDAGYENGNIARILDTLKQENVPAAFFVLGNIIKKETHLIERMITEGHTVCNHTYSHKDMTRCETIEEFQEELRILENAYYDCTGKEMAKYYRPPEGRFSEENLKFASELGYKTIFWSFAYADWDNNKQMSAEKAKDKILSNIHNGAVILLHPNSKTNADILADVIKELKLQGYSFGTLDMLTQKI